MDPRPTSVKAEDTPAKLPDEALHRALTGCALLEAADGAGSLVPWMAISSPDFSFLDALQINQPLSVAELRYHAIQEFRRAADAFPETSDAFPGKSWVWFQIGWYSFAYDDGPRDIPLAQSALEHVLALVPYH